jgi:hypothetical protein
MKKQLLLFTFLLLTTLMFSQQLVESGKSYSEVVEAELTKDDIYQKLKEWISLTYKSAKDVIQLDTKEKLITKGNTIVNYVSGEYNVKYRISFTLILSIRDNKYKIDFTPTKVSSDLMPTTYIDTRIYELLMSNEVISKEDYMVSAKEMALKTYKNYGWSDKKSKKMLKKYNKELVKGYDSYKLNKQSFEKEIKNLYTSIKNTVNKKDKDW